MPPPDFTSESLNLSASLFTSSISSWIPANFGYQPPPEQTEKEWQQILLSAGEGKDRLGLGHPLTNAPKSRGQTGYGRGIQGLEQSLKRKKGGEGQGEDEKRKGEESDEEEEEESRASMVGKKKRTAVFDPLGNRKKKVGGGSGGNSVVASARTSPAVDGTLSLSTTQNKAADTPTTTSGAAIVNSANASTALPTTASLTSITESSTQTSDPAQPSGSISTSPTKSKSAFKREKKRRAKLAREAQTAGAA